MSRRLTDLGGGKPLLDIASYARRGPGRRDHLSHEITELIERTVRRTPEVMVKVLSRGGRDLKAVGRHIAYLNRGGELGIETDDGQRLSGKGVENELLEDWDLELEEHRYRAVPQPRPSRPPPKLIHKIMFSMPAGTPPDQVLSAVKNFAREEFALKHRYAMVLHTDEPHPHVHMVVKAVSEQGERLNIRKATLREWRRDFSWHLRALGVPANATERAVRGQTQKAKTDRIYRSEQRGVSRRAWGRAQSIMHELRNGGLRSESGKAKLLSTRDDIERGWRAASDILVSSGRRELATLARQFVARFRAPRTEREQLAANLQNGDCRLPDVNR
jgi:hypothetical protein